MSFVIVSILLICLIYITFPSIFQVAEQSGDLSGEFHEAGKSVDRAATCLDQITDEVQQVKDDYFELVSLDLITHIQKPFCLLVSFLEIS